VPNSNTTVEGFGPIGAMAIGELGPIIDVKYPLWPPLSTPPHFQRKINPQHAAALATAGSFQIINILFPELITEDKWHFPFSTPVRVKPGLGAAYQQTFNLDTLPIPTSKGMGWFAPVSSPVRQPIGLKSYLQDYAPFKTLPVIIPSIASYYPYSTPVRIKPGFRYYLQQSLAYHPRLLPNPSVTATWNSTETGEDEALFAVNVYDAVSGAVLGYGARVSIIETETGA